VVDVRFDGNDRVDALADFTAFPCVVFIIYACHWCSLAHQTEMARTILPSQGSAQDPAAVASAGAFAAGQGMYNVVMYEAAAALRLLCRSLTVS